MCTLLRGKRQVQVMRPLALNSILLRQTKEEQTLGVDTVLGRRQIEQGRKRAVVGKPLAILAQRNRVGGGPPAIPAARPTFRVLLHQVRNFLYSHVAEQVGVRSFLPNPGSFSGFLTF
jgi:hypothetical protein